MDWAGSLRTSLLSLANQYIDLLAEAESDTEDLEDNLVSKENTLRELIISIDHPMVIALGRTFAIDRYPGGLILRRNRLEDIGGLITGGKAIPLDTHQAGVANWGRRLAPLDKRDIVHAAGAIHDEGKREARFQAMLYGNPITAAAGPALAKSGLQNRQKLRLAYAASGLPRGFRHELASLTYVSVDDALVRHLVATHHGYGRPWFPACADPSAKGHQLTHVDSGWAQSFFAATRIYGTWGLAGLESALRAADARQSIEEQEND
jgi:CRISPR-associated endonuclease/helicase Cas3